MKKLLLVGIVVALIGATAAFVFMGSSSGGVPGVAGYLSASHTASLVGAQDLLLLSQLVEDVAGKPGKLPPKFANKEARKASLGFEPMTAEGWAKTGIDPTGGINIVLDGRVFQHGSAAPIYLLKLADESRFAAFITERTGQPSTFTKGGLQVGGRLIASGMRGPLRAFVPGGPAAKVSAGFKSFLAEPQAALATHGSYQTSYADAPSPTLHAYGETASLIRLFSTHIPAVVGDHYAKLFPSMAFYANADWSGARLVASEKGARVLQRLLVPSGSSPKFSQFIPPTGWTFMRWTLNPKEFLAGLGDLIPPEAPEQLQGALTMVPTALGLIGLSVEDIAATFSGHFVVAADFLSLKSVGRDPAQVEAVLLIGLKDVARADMQVKTLVSTAAKFRLPFQPVPIEVEGAKGFSLVTPEISPVVLRRGKVLLFATSKAAATRALSRSQTIVGEPAKALDGDAIFSVGIGGAEMALLIKDISGLSTLEIPSLTGRSLVGSVHLDRRGLLARIDSLGLRQMLMISTHLPLLSSAQ